MRLKIVGKEFLEQDGIREKRRYFVRDLDPGRPVELGVYFNEFWINEEVDNVIVDAFILRSCHREFFEEYIKRGFEYYARKRPDFKSYN